MAGLLKQPGAAGSKGAQNWAGGTPSSRPCAAGPCAAGPPTINAGARAARAVGCIFCDIVAGRRPAHVVYEDAAHVAFLDKYPIDCGHTLVVPRAHHERITDMDPAAVEALFGAVPGVARAMMGAAGAVAFNVAQNNGREAMQIVPHVHVHVIPRRAGRRAGWSKRSIVPDAELAALAGRARSALRA